MILAIVHKIYASRGEMPEEIARGIPPLNSIKGSMLKIMANTGSIIKRYKTNYKNLFMAIKSKKPMGTMP